MTFTVPGNLWKYLGIRPNTPFVPFQAQAEIFGQVRIPWPGMVRWQDHPKYARDSLPPQLSSADQYEQRKDGLYVRYPSAHALNCGRRFSKTTLGEKFLWNGLLAPDDIMGPPTVRMTSDTEEHCYKIWDKFIHHLTTTDLKGLLDFYSRDRELVQLKNGATAQLVSANNPDALAGDGVTTWVIDEMQAQQFTMRAWENLFPSTSDREGIIVALGVCENAGPYRMISQWGKDKGRPDFMTYSFPTAANPFVPRWRIKFAQDTLSPTKFKQLYLAMWENELGALFRNVQGCINGKTVLEHEKGWRYSVPPMFNREYVAGLDLGRLSDWTPLSIWRPDGELVAWDRMSLVDWEVQKGRVVNLLREYGFGDPAKITVWVDSTGIGDPITQDLSLKGLSVVPVPLSTNPRKNALVDSLSLRIGAGNASYPRIPELIEELENYEATKTEGGAVRYSAPAGGHDDWVISAALANEGMPSYAAPPQRDPDEDDEDRQHSSWDAIV